MTAKFLTAKFLTIFALMAFGLVCLAQTHNPNVREADSSTAASLATNAAPPNAGSLNGRTLFLKNCAHCHGATAHGDDGPDLHDLGFTDDWIANRIRKGKAGQMTAFAGKLQPAEIDALVAYVQSLK
jgi:mono/diheme cytochrome c family protein